jgi:hypothetical protein
MLGGVYLLQRTASFWLWRARLSGSYLADRFSYVLFLTVGILASLTLDFQVIRVHVPFPSIWIEGFVMTLPAILIGEFLYLRKVTSIIQTLALLRSRNTRMQKP